MKRYFRIYRALLKINLIAMFSYRANFINSTISSFTWGVFGIVTIVLITSRTESAFGWRREDLILLAATYSMVVGLFHLFFARNFERFARLIAGGKFDTVLLKPLDSQFSISFWEINYAALSRVTLGSLVIIYLIHRLSYEPSIFNVIFFFFIIVFGVLVLYSLWLIGATFMIKVPQLTNIIELMYTINGFIRYPQEMYKKVSGLLFLIVFPIVFVAVTPMRVLMGNASYKDIGALIIICITLLILSRIFWRFGLRSYTSASN